ncbi:MULTISPECIES: c-type cytochrome [unclassified Bradyrhizobium]|jgi:cytochrome c2|uniref:c-type cytochrome n=1 Tax=unclassified Bradyrhizobium TaxID=2631580 RepID=UPI00070AEAAB|nr:MULTISPECIES: c-type cytochrome [unclassified Bradyrhizobium]KQT20739.1 hypothetical protein ASG57_27125 [Bradyrhizobium sp. Leaf396]
MKGHAMVAFAAIVLGSPAIAQTADMSQGQQLFRACAPCHSLESDRNMTGPSLASLWGRKAGSLPSFERYSDALKSSGTIWDDRSLDGWLTDPDRMVPDNDMPFNGIKDERARADLLAFLKEATRPGAPKQPCRLRPVAWAGCGIALLLVSQRRTYVPKQLRPCVYSLVWCRNQIGIRPPAAIRSSSIEQNKYECPGDQAGPDHRYPKQPIVSRFKIHLGKLEFQEAAPLADC